MKIDLHNHVWTGEAVGENFLDEDMRVESLIEAMDVAGVDRAGICSVAQEVQNDYVLECVRRYPDRVFGYVFVNPRQKDAVSEMRKYLDEGMCGVKVHPHLHGYSLSNHDLMDPIMEVCAEYQVPIFGHGNSNEFNTPFDFEEMARSFPDVTVILGHMGSFSMVDSAILAAGRTRNLFLDTSLCASGDVKNAVKQVGADKLFMATDWPGSDFRVEEVKVKVACEKTEGAWEKISHLNFAKLPGVMKAR